MQQARHIVIIGPAHPFRGGIADTNEAMCRAFLRQGHRAELVTFTVQYPSLFFPGKTQFSPDPHPEGLTIYRWIHTMNPFTWWNAARKLRSRNPDLVIIRYWLPLLAPCLGTVARLLKKRMKVVGLTDNVIPHERRLLDAAFTRFFMKGCDAFMALSSAVRKDIQSLTDKPSSYYPHPINDDLGDPVSREEALAKLGLDAGFRYLLFFGMVRHYKGLDLLLKALADERLRNDQVKLIVAGEFYEPEEEYRALIHSLGLEDRVIVFNAFIPGSELRYYFCAADAVAQTYRTATQSGITQMALHFDVPAIVTRVGGLEEFVDDGRTGFFTEPEPTAIAEGIRAFLSADPVFLRANIRGAKNRFSWDAFVDHFCSFADQNLER